MTRTSERARVDGEDGRAAVAAALDRWEREGLVSAEQADQLRAELSTGRLPAPPSGPVRESLLTEALSYLGGVLVLVAGGLLTARFWDDLSFGGRATLAAAATLLLLGAGVVVPGRLGAAGTRVRSVLWVLAVGACAALLAIVALDGWDLEGEPVGMVVAGGAGALAATLWWQLRSSLQLLALAATGGVFAGTTAAQLSGDRDGAASGLAVLGLAALGGAAALRGWAEPVRTALAAAAAGGIVGALVTTSGDDGWAHLLAVGVVTAVVVAAVRLDDLLLLGIGAVGALQVLPRAVAHFFPGLVAAAVVLLVAGAALIASGLAIARRRARAHTPDG